MIYRYRVYEEAEKNALHSQHYKNALKNQLEGFPQHLSFVLSDAEVHNEFLDLSKKEAYLKITTDLEESTVVSLVKNSIKISGLNGSRLI